MMSRTASVDSRSDSFDIDQQNRSRVFSSIFNLPDEELVDDFTCALLKSSVLLFQGRLFVSRDHVCFYSALLSAEERAIIIPFENIIEISKKNTAWVVPNAIQLRLKDGTEYFFASFLSRNRCYDLLQNIFQKESTPEISSVIGASQDSSPEHSVDSTRDASVLVPESPSLGSVPATDSPDTVEHEESAALTQCCELSLDQFESKLSESYWGKPGLDLKEMGRYELPFPMRDVFSKLYADTGTIYSSQQHLESLGANDINFTPWKVENGVTVRNGSLIMPITNPLSTVRSTRVQETCYCCYDPSTDSFHFRSESLSLDAPYGDCFTVLVAYDFCPVEDNDQRCSVTGQVAVYFIKSVWALKSFIISSTIDGVRNAFDLWSKSVISTCSEGQEIPVPAVRRESSVDKYHRPPKMSKLTLPSFTQYIENFRLKQRYLLFISVGIALVAVLTSSFSFPTTKTSTSSSDMCFMLPDVLAECSKMDGSLPDLFLAELYANALLARFRSSPDLIPNEIVMAINDLGEVLHDFIEKERREEDTKSVVNRLERSTQQLRSIY